MYKKTILLYCSFPFFLNQEKFEGKKNGWLPLVGNTWGKTKSGEFMNLNLPVSNVSDQTSFSEEEPVVTGTQEVSNELYPTSTQK